MTRAEALARGRAVLAGSPTAALDASLLLARLLGLRREALLAAGAEELEPGLLEHYEEALASRAAGRPVAYLLGEKEFFGRVFLVDDSVLVPRPDTELLVELALAEGDRLAAGRPGPLRVHECCVGSGAVAVSVAAERPGWLVSASDLSEAALATAARNAARLLSPDRAGGPLVLRRSDLLEDVGPGAGPAVGPFDLILANPPYVEAELARELASNWGEPLLALDGGPDGLDLIRRLLPLAFSRLAPGGLLLVEADGAQARELRRLFADAGFAAPRSRRDLAGIERITLGEHP